MNILHIDSSVLGEASASRGLTKAVVEKWKKSAPGLKVRYRDFGSEAPQHLSPELLAVRATDEAKRSPAQKDEANLADTLIEEFMAADGIVIGAPLYNFTIPSGLKAWIDRIAVAGKTFRYTAEGPVGLAGPKRVIIVATSGGRFSETPVDQAHVGHLKTVLGFLGITDVTVIRAEGLAIDAESRATAIANAKSEIDEQFSDKRQRMVA